MSLHGMAARQLHGCPDHAVEARSTTDNTSAQSGCQEVRLHVVVLVDKLSEPHYSGSWLLLRSKTHPDWSKSTEKTGGHKRPGCLDCPGSKLLCMHHLPRLCIASYGLLQGRW